MYSKNHQIRKQKRLRKFNCLLVLFSILVMVVLFTGGFSAKAEDIPVPRNYVLVNVCAGDSLWSLVEEYYAYPGNIRAAIKEVKEWNGLKSSTIYCGQVLEIPTR